MFGWIALLVLRLLLHLHGLLLGRVLGGSGLRVGACWICLELMHFRGSSSPDVDPKP